MDNLSLFVNILEIVFALNDPEQIVCAICIWLVVVAVRNAARSLKSAN